MTWQTVAVIVIEALAVGFLLLKILGPRRRPKVLQKPDVKASSLVRPKRSAPED